VTEHWESNSSS